MNNFKEHIFKLSHIKEPFTPCTIISGTDKIADPFFYLDGFNTPTTVSLTFLLYDVINDDLGNLMQIGINGNILTENVPLILNVLVTPNGGVLYDYEAEVTPVTNYDGDFDSFKINMSINNLGESNCINGTQNETLTFGTPVVVEEENFSNILLWSDTNFSCPTNGPVSYYINDELTDWTTATELTTDAAGNIPAPAGHYSPSLTSSIGSGTSREWDGNSFVSSEVCS